MPINLSLHTKHKALFKALEQRKIKKLKNTPEFYRRIIKSIRKLPDNDFKENLYGATKCAFKNFPKQINYRILTNRLGEYYEYLSLVDKVKNNKNNQAEQLLLTSTRMSNYLLYNNLCGVKLNSHPLVSESELEKIKENSRKGTAAMKLWTEMRKKDIKYERMPKKLKKLPIHLYKRLIILGNKRKTLQIKKRRKFLLFNNPPKPTLGTAACVFGAIPFIKYPPRYNNLHNTERQRVTAEKRYSVNLYKDISFYSDESYANIVLLADLSEYHEFLSIYNRKNIKNNDYFHFLQSFNDAYNDSYNFLTKQAQKVHFKREKQWKYLYNKLLKKRVKFERLFRKKRRQYRKNNI